MADRLKDSLIDKTMEKYAQEQVLLKLNHDL